VKTIISALVAAAVMFGLAGLFTGVLAKEFIVSNVDSALLRNPPDLLITFLGYLFLAALMAYTYRFFVQKFHSPAKSGLFLGLASAVVWMMPYSVVLFSIYNFPYIALPLDFAWVLVEQGVGGILIGLIQGRRQQA